MIPKPLFFRIRFLFPHVLPMVNTTACHHHVPSAGHALRDTHHGDAEESMCLRSFARSDKPTYRELLVTQLGLVSLCFMTAGTDEQEIV